MKKLIAMVAVAAGLVLGSVANAAPIEINLNQTNATTWELVVTNTSASGVGAVNLLTTGLTTLTVNPLNTAISALDSSISIDPLALGLDSVIVANVAGQTIAFNTGIATLLATLTGDGPVTLQGFENPDVGGIGAYTTAGIPYDAADLAYHVNPLVVPEPATMVLLGLGLAALGMVRRTA